jgi:hypothetical protein
VQAGTFRVTSPDMHMGSVMTYQGSLPCLPSCINGIMQNKRGGGRPLEDWTCRPTMLREHTGGPPAACIRYAPR